MQQVQLLYTYRNFLIHEMRRPGRGMDFDENDVEPYYHSTTYELGTSREVHTWRNPYRVRRGHVEFCSKGRFEPACGRGENQRGKGWSALRRQYAITAHRWGAYRYFVWGVFDTPQTQPGGADQPAPRC